MAKRDYGNNDDSKSIKKGTLSSAMDDGGETKEIKL